MFKGFKYFIILILAFLACEEEKEDVFLSEADTSVTAENIVGTWYVFAGEYMNRYIETPSNFPECGFNYIVFADSGEYQEIVYDDYDCVPLKINGNWKLQNGIIIVSNLAGDIEKFPVIEYEPSQLTINFRFDFDNDGTNDIFKAYLRPYDPITNNHVATSFKRDLKENSLLKFEWKQETDIDSFSSYEIYRSVEGTCSKEEALLLTEINDISTTTFIDFNPPTTQDNLCYFLRVYADGIMVGESKLLIEDPSKLTIKNTLNLNNASVKDENIFLEWNHNNIPYFSHYELVYANSEGNLFYEEGSIALIDNIEQTSFLIDPPYIENPYFAIYAYNIFGNSVVSNYKQITYRRADLFGPIYLKHIEIDEEESAVYLHGSSQIPSWASYNKNAVLRLNYSKGIIESTTENEVYVAGEYPFRKPINFLEGRELVINGRSNLYFLNPTSLIENSSFGNFYLYEEFDLFGVVDFTYTKNDFFVVIDTDSVFVFQRNGNELVLLDKQIHYTTHHGDNLYRIVRINDNEILIGHKTEEESILYTVDDSGILQNKRTVTIPLSSSFIVKYKNDSFYSDSNNAIINYGDRTLYSTITFQPKVQMSEDLFALGLAKDSKYIFASTINPAWFGSDIKTELLKREVILFDTETSEIQSVKTKGYPIRVFENNKGELFSISIPENQSIVNFDVFVEKINFL